MRLAGKTAIVTGGASGFGAGIVRKFATEGARVMIVDLNLDAAEALADELGESVSAFQCNVAKSDEVARMTSAAIDRMGQIDILVNNAGITHLPAPMEDISEDDFDRVLAVNAKSVYLTARHIVPHMKARKTGSILNVASTAGVSPRPRLSWYNASKGWMITATRSMAVELAPEGIRVNAINPVAGETPLLKSFMGEDTPEIRAKFLSTIPMGRFSTPDDMGNAACYLCSDEASMVTGVCMEVDGGRCI
ncbi:SDR family oxidoreductase [Qingshengfaniella alkalisoli]|uniref:SDR family oxidoreductase n=1 Tax=Qingshengfaniella alkalisoli TaxID=2599296 RepID=A0A5B8J1M6_9RHOB|nr:SDR family oxidoreductase [Qingshengfaniella alkalisoli]QDY71673.1 SDR family oxidoreductase [Qingshengfaniella alkalisoli]